jgi:hypothetical protein
MNNCRSMAAALVVINLGHIPRSLLPDLLGA